MLRRAVLTLILVFGFMKGADAQLLSFKDAEKCLDDSLVLLDEESRSYIARFEGTQSTLNTRDGSLAFREIFGYSVEQASPSRGEYHCLGVTNFPSGSWSDRIFWRDSLRAGGKVHYRAGFERADGATPVQHIKDGNEWRSPEIDPFGLPFAAEGDFLGRKSQFESKLPNLLNMDFVKSERLGEGGVRGTWILAKSYRVIDFDPKQGHLPVRVRIYFWDPVKEVKGPLFIENTLTWKSLGKHDGSDRERWVPISFNGKYALPPPGEHKTELQLNFQWVRDGQTRECDLTKLANTPPVSFRRYFDGFFPESSDD